MTRLAVCSGLLACACLWFPSAALARPANDTATRTYFHADLGYLRAVYDNASASAAAIEARGQQIATECPGSLTYAPRDAAFEALGEEISTTLIDVGVAPVRSATLRFAHSIAHLSWTRRMLTHLVHRQAAEESAIATLTLPDVCPQIAAWKASAYATLPKSTTEFTARLQAIESSSASEEDREATILRMLKPYETRAQRKTAKTIERLSGLTEKRLSAVGAKSRAVLAAALGVSAL